LQLLVDSLLADSGEDGQFPFLYLSCAEGRGLLVGGDEVPDFADAKGAGLAGRDEGQKLVFGASKEFEEVLRRVDVGAADVREGNRGIWWGC
jgi:hypothetical protein